VESVLRQIREETGARSDAAVDFPGQPAARRGKTLEQTRQLAKASADTRRGNSIAQSLSIPGEVELPEIGWAVSAHVEQPGMSQMAETWQATVDSATVRSPLFVRTRVAGDALRPVGLGGRKKLQDLFVDRKVPRGDRDRLPLIVDGSGRLVWVVGHGIAEDFRVTDRTRGVIILKAKRLGG
jgi:tRNA(Ile)-lysidine synthase